MPFPVGVTTVVFTVLAGVIGALPTSSYAGPPSPVRVDESIVVTAQRPSVPDEVVAQHIATALHLDPYFYDGHVTVTVKNGIARLEGIVFDDWDLRIALRKARKIPGVKRVVNELEISSNGSD